MSFKDWQLFIWKNKLYSTVLLCLILCDKNWNLDSIWMNLILLKKLNTCTISCGSFKVLWFGSRDSVYGGFDTCIFFWQYKMQIIVVFIIVLFINEIVYKLTWKRFNEYQFILGIAFSLPSWECYFCNIFLFILLGTLVSASYFMYCLNTWCFIQSFSYIYKTTLYSH